MGGGWQSVRASGNFCLPEYRTTQTLPHDYCKFMTAPACRAYPPHVMRGNLQIDKEKPSHMNTGLPCIPRKGFGARLPRRPFVVFLSLSFLAAGLAWSAPASSATKPAAFAIFRDKAAFEAALDAT